VHSLTVHLADTFTPTAEMGQDAERATALAGHLTDRARGAGRLRSGIVNDDVQLVLEGCAAIRVPDAARTRQLRRRYLALLLDGMHMELATARPQRWWALGFIATTAQPVTAAERADRLAKARTAEEQGLRPLAEEMAARLFGPGPDQAMVARVMAMMLASSPLGAAAALRGRAERPDYRPLLRSVSASSLVCAGDHDTFSTAAVTAELASCLHEPQLVVLDSVGHLPNLERPGDFNEQLLGFLRRAWSQPGVQSGDG
jgi:pimeloyl-ACP methyl ester carboxylesterase